jgi:hypothetical protein
VSDEQKPVVAVFCPVEKAGGQYANLCMVTHGREEVIFDFIFMGPHLQPGMPAPVLQRIVTSPPHAKRLLQALIDNLKKYEERFGPIVADEPPPMPLN